MAANNRWLKGLIRGFLQDTGNAKVNQATTEQPCAGRYFVTNCTHNFMTVLQANWLPSSLRSGNIKLLHHVNYTIISCFTTKNAAQNTFIYKTSLNVDNFKPLIVSVTYTKAVNNISFATGKIKKALLYRSAFRFMESCYFIDLTNSCCTFFVLSGAMISTWYIPPATPCGSLSK